MVHSIDNAITYRLMKGIFLSIIIEWDVSWNVNFLNSSFLREKKQ